MIRAVRLFAAAICVAGCKFTATRPDQDSFVLDTSKVPVERFQDALSNRLSGPWEASDYAPPDADRSKMYELDGSGVVVVLVPMIHGRCDSNASHHMTYDPAYRIDFVYRTSSPDKREAAKRKLFEAASDVNERLARFEECPR